MFARNIFREAGPERQQRERERERHSGGVGVVAGRHGSTGARVRARAVALPAGHARGHVRRGRRGNKQRARERAATRLLAARADRIRTSRVARALARARLLLANNQPSMGVSCVF